jgi:serine/threonine protein kinase
MMGNILSSRYELIERVGEGVLFDAYRARDIAHGRALLIKILKEPYNRNTNLLEILKQVCAARASLRFPNIIQFYGLDDDGVQWFITEEFVKGLDLKTRILRTAPFTVPIAVEIGIGVAEALTAAHASGVTHGDLRPQHIIIGADWHVWVNEFGFAPLYRLDPLLAAAHEAKSVYYTAPEILEDKPASIQSDLYSLGVVMFEMLTGSLPFDAETPLLVAQAHQQQPVPSLRARNGAIPRTVEGIVLKCLQKSPDDRYARVMDVLNELKAVRDALRFGKPLNWSPVETPTTEPPSAKAATATVNAENPSNTFFAAAAKNTQTVAPATQPSPAKRARAREDEYDEAEDDEIPGWLRFLLRTMLVVVVLSLLIGGAAWFAFQMAPQDRPVPKLVGKSLQEGKQIASEAGFDLQVKREDYNEQYSPGTIFLLNPDEGRLLKKGSTLEVWVSQGTRYAQVPSVRNMPESQARVELEKAGFVVMDETVEKTSEQVPFGFVLGSVPPAKTKIERSKPIKLIISIGSGDNSDTGVETSPPLEESPTVTSEPRIFGVKVDLRGQEAQRIRIEVEDELGVHNAVDEMREGGMSYDYEVQAQGKKVKIRIYVDEVLIREMTR